MGAGCSRRRCGYAVRARALVREQGESGWTGGALTGAYDRGQGQLNAFVVKAVAKGARVFKESLEGRYSMQKQGPNSLNLLRYRHE